MNKHIGTRFLGPILLACVALSSPALAQKASSNFIFSKEPIKAGAAASTDLEFKAGERIFARILLNKKLSATPAMLNQDTSNVSAPIQVEVKNRKDEFVMGFMALRYTAKQGEQSYIDLELVPDPATARTRYYTTSFLDLLGQGQIDKKKNLIIFSVGEGADAHEGQIVLDLSNADLSKYSALSEQANQAAESFFEHARALPDVFNAPSVALKEPELNKVEKIKQILAANDQFSDLAEFKKIAVGKTNAGEEWSVVRNELGIPLYKKLNHPVLVYWKSKDGKCFVSTPSFDKNNEGGATYGKVVTGRLLTNPEEYACDR
ncbi:MAG: hypothetical protein V4582_18960 [Pseudomonadota bacterium]